MTQLTPEELIASGRDWFRRHRADYIASRGAKGHIISLEHDGGRPFATHCLLRTIGRNSGRAYINPLFYAIHGGEVVLMGSAAGSPRDPQWMNNLRAAEEVQVQIAGQAFRATSRIAGGEERQQVWDYVLTNHPAFATYQSRTDRPFPIAMLRTFEEIPVFTEADYDHDYP